MTRSAKLAGTKQRFKVGGLMAVAFAVGDLARHGHAAAVVVNPSFDVTNQGGSSVPLFAGDYTKGMGSTLLNPYRNNAPVMVAGWESNAQDFTAGAENSGATIAPNDGATAYVALQGVISQTLAGGTDGGIYVLSVEVYRRSDREFNPFTMRLLNASTGLAYTPISSDNPTPEAGVFAVWTQTYNISASSNALKIEFEGTGMEKGTNLDHVLLTVVPEPSALIALGCGALCLGQFGRMRRNA